MIEERGLACCGMIEITNLAHTDFTLKGSAAQVFKAVRASTSLDRRAFMVFSVVLSGAKKGDDGAGGRLAAYIVKNRLGVCLSTPRRRNPNSGNVIKAWVWVISHRGLKAWDAKHKVKEG